MHLQVDEVEARAGALMLLHFQNGYVSEEFSKKRPSAALLSDNDKMVVATEIEDTLYVGEESKEELGKTLLLVKSHKTGKVRLLEVGTASMRAVLSAPHTLQGERANALQMSRVFGSKRGQQAIEQRERLKVNAQTMNDQLKEVAEKVKSGKEIDLKTYTQVNTEDSYIPPINRDAKNVTEVYKICDILTDDQIDTIKTEMQNQEWSSDLHPFIKNLVKGGSSAVENVLILYANSLLNLYTTILRDIVKRSYKACEFSYTLNEICMEQFIQTVNNRRLRPNNLKDKTLCHLMVILLLLNNFKFPLHDFANMVKISPATIVMKAKVCGAQLSSDKKSIILKLPLVAVNTMKRRSNKF